MMQAPFSVLSVFSQQPDTAANLPSHDCSVISVSLTEDLFVVY